MKPSRRRWIATFLPLVLVFPILAQEPTEQLLESTLPLIPESRLFEEVATTDLFVDVDPGEFVEWEDPDRGQADDSGGTWPSNYEASFSLSDRKISLDVATIGVVGGGWAAGWLASPWFRVTGQTGRYYDATITVSAEWSGILLTAAAITSEAQVTIKARVWDGTDQKYVGEETLESEHCSSSVLGGCSRSVVGTGTVNVPVKLLSGHSYTVYLWADASSSAVAATAEGYFSGDGGIWWKNATVAVDIDIAEALNEIKQDLSDHDSRVASSFGAVQTQIADHDGVLDDHDEEMRRQAALINDGLEQIKSMLDEQAAFDLMMRIHESLALQNARIAILELPASHQGYLEMVRQVLVDSMEATGDSGQTLHPQVGILLGRGDRKYGQGNYRGAYEDYREAYQHLTRDYGNNAPHEEVSPGATERLGLGESDPSDALDDLEQSGEATRRAIR